MKLLLNLWRFLNSIFLQLLLSFVAFISYIEVSYFRNSYNNGVAIAMGLITCMCIFCIVWLQVNKSKKNKHIFLFQFSYSFVI